MKAMFDNGCLINIVPDSYVAGNLLYDSTLIDIKGSDDGVPLEVGSCIDLIGNSKYKIENGILMHSDSSVSNKKEAKVLQLTRTLSCSIFSKYSLNELLLAAFDIFIKDDKSAIATFLDRKQKDYDKILKEIKKATTEELEAIDISL